MQHVNDYTPTTLQPISYDNFAYFTGKESIFEIEDSDEKILGTEI